MDGEYNADLDQYYPFRVPLRKDMADSDYFTAHPQFNAFVEGFEFPSIEVPSPDWSIVRDGSLQAEFSAIASGDKTVLEAVTAIGVFATDNLS